MHFFLAQPHNVAASQNGYGSDEESFNDNESMFSYQSETYQGSTEEKEEEVDINEKFEEKLLQALENAAEKSAQTRTNALQVIFLFVIFFFII